jgi:hypothetical protein
MKTNPYTVKLPSIGLRSHKHEVFARDPAVRREIIRGCRLSSSIAGIAA